MKIEVGLGRITKTGVLTPALTKKGKAVRKYLLRVQINGEERQFSFSKILQVQKFMMKRGYLWSKEETHDPKKGKFEVQLYQIVGKLA